VVNEIYISAQLHIHSFIDSDVQFEQF
jgi:hypothetical protein